MTEKEEFEALELAEISVAVAQGHYSGITAAGTTWSIEINFDYEGGGIKP